LSFANKGYVCCESTRQSCPVGDQCCEDDDGPYCAVKCLPTLKFPHVPGVTNEVGMRVRGMWEDADGFIASTEHLQR
jgi:hypothetical protein